MLTMQRTLRSHPTPDHEAVTSISSRSNHAVSGHINGARIFGPEAADIRVHPRRGQPDSDLEQNVLKPRAGMIIRLTPELLATLQSPSPKPTVELVLKSAVEGGPLLVVDGVQHKTHSHKMAVGSEVHVVARTEPANGRGTSVGGLQAEGQAPRKGEQTRTTPSMSIFASLHRKLIVQQVLTAAKRAEIRARKHEIDLQEKQAKNKMKRMDDEDGMLAAAESMPLPSALPSALPSLQPAAASVGVGGWTESQHLKDGKRSRSPSGLGKSEGEDEEDGKRRREQDPLTAWVYDCYRDDSYTGHVSDLRQFFKGIDLQHVMFRYHVLPDGMLEPDRRRFCIKFKTKAGRDLAIGRSGEVLRAAGSSLCVAVVRGRNELASGDGDDGRVSDFLLALPPGRSVADILKEVRARLPDDLTPALGTPEWAGATPEEKMRFKSSSSRGEHDRYNFKSGEHHRLDIRRETLMSAYRRDMLRAALGATVAEAGALGPQRGAPSARIVGTDEDNSRRVATLAANEAKRELELSWKGVGMMKPNSRGERPQIAVGPGGGARAQRRRILEEG